MYNHDKVTQKLNDLYWKVHNGPPKGKDLLWIRNMLSDVKDGGLVPSKDEFKKANVLWKKYVNPTVVSDDTMWSLIDALLEDQEPSKIQAIKLYRKHTKCSLREAKDVIDARQEKLKRGW